MIELKKAFQTLTSEEYKYLLDAPVWLALMAAFDSDGKVSKHERADAVKLAHLRTFTASKALRPYYAEVDEHFAQRFDTLAARLPQDAHQRELYIKGRVKQAHMLLNKLDSDVAEPLEKSLESFYEHVFKADKSFFQYFALPVISSDLDKQSGHFDFDTEA